MNLSFILLFLHLWGNIEVSLSQNACSKLPDVPHANIEYKEGDVIHFTCAPGYSSAQASKYVCTNDGWLAVSQGKCYSCSTLPEVPHANVSEETKKSEYQEGDVIHFTCESGYTSGPVIKYVCSSDGWLAVRQGTCNSPSGCGRPPPLADGDIFGIPKSEYRLNERVKYSCQAYHIMQGGPFKTCQNGEWTGEMRCLKPCTVDREMMNSHNIAFRYTHEDRLYSTHGDALYFMCTRGRPVGTVGMRQSCNDGVMELPSCQ